MPERFDQRSVRILLTTFAVCTIFSFITAVAYGVYLIRRSNTMHDDFEFPIATNTVDVPDDWAAVPIVDIRVGQGTKCPLGSEAVFQRIWYGMNLACDCTQLGAVWYAKKDFIIGKSCDFRSGCATKIQYEEIQVCAIRRGRAFVDMQRAIDDQGNCPQGTVPCIQNQTKVENIICYPQNQHIDFCPVTDIRVVSQTQVSNYTSQGYTARNLDNETAIVFSKKVDKMPPTSIRTEWNPCINQLEQSINPEEKETVFPAELVSPGCSVDPQFERRTDPRYQKTGFETNEYDVQLRSGVTQSSMHVDLYQNQSYFIQQFHSRLLNILDSEPQYRIYEPHVLEKTKSVYYGWTRPTIDWNISCEWHGMSRKHAYTIYKDHPINTTPAEQPDMLWSFGVYAICFAFLGPLLACVCQLTAKRNDDSGFSCLVGMVIGSISGYFCLLLHSVFAVFAFKEIGDLIQYNLDSLPLYDQINSCVDEYTKLNTSTFLYSITNLKESFDYLINLNWIFFALTWLPLFVPSLTYLIIVLQAKQQSVQRTVQRRDVANSRALDVDLRQQFRRLSSNSEQDSSFDQNNPPAGAPRRQGKKKKSRRRRPSTGDPVSQPFNVSNQYSIQN